NWRCSRRRPRGGLHHAEHDSFGEGARMACGLSDLGGGRTLSRSDERAAGGARGRAAPDVRREHPRARRILYQLSHLHDGPAVRPRDGAGLALPRGPRPQRPPDRDAARGRIGTVVLRAPATQAAEHKGDMQPSWVAESPTRWNTKSSFSPTRNERKLSPPRSIFESS